MRPLFDLLTPRPYTVRTIGELLDMSREALQALLREHEEVLIDQGVQFHVAPKSDVRSSVALPSRSDPNIPAHYSKLSRPATT